MSFELREREFFERHQIAPDVERAGTEQWKALCDIEEAAAKVGTGRTFLRTPLGRKAFVAGYAKALKTIGKIAGENTKG